MLEPNFVVGFVWSEGQVSFVYFGDFESLEAETSENLLALMNGLGRQVRRLKASQRIVEELLDGDYESQTQFNIERVLPTLMFVSGIQPHATSELQSALKSCSQIVADRFSEFQQNLTRITPRESEVYELLLAGRSATEISQQLEISANTVGKHKLAVLRKLSVSDHTTLLLQELTFSSEAADD